TTDFKAISKKIAAGEGTIGKLLNDESMYGSIAVTLNKLQEASANAEHLTASLSAYGSKLNQKGNLANDLVTDTTLLKSVRATISELQKVASAAAELTANLKNSTSDPN